VFLTCAIGREIDPEAAFAGLVLLLLMWSSIIVLSIVLYFNMELD
jgi:hypothetical protein